MPGKGCADRSWLPSTPTRRGANSASWGSLVSARTPSSSSSVSGFSRIVTGSATCSSPALLAAPKPGLSWRSTITSASTTSSSGAVSTAITRASGRCRSQRRAQHRELARRPVQDGHDGDHPAASRRAARVTRAAVVPRRAQRFHRPRLGVRAHRLGQHAGVVDGDVGGPALCRLAHLGEVRDDRRRAVGERLDGGQAEALQARRGDERQRPRIEAGERRVVDPRADLEPGNRHPPRAHRDDPQAGAPRRFGEHVDPLARLEGADEQEVRVLRVHRTRRHRDGRRERGHPHPLGREPPGRDQVAPPHLRGGQHERRAAGKRARPRRSVPAGARTR